MKYTINELKDKIYSDIYAVYDIFKNHFGEEFVDLQFVDHYEVLIKDRNFLPSGVTMEAFPDTDLTDAQIDEIIENIEEYKPTILVWWPQVTVTNEHDKSINIKDLYAKIPLSLDGTIPFESGGFYLARSTWSMAEWVTGYSHSHLPGIPTSNLSKFEHPCLGRGPIRNTINSLKLNNDELTWMLFCQELSVYVTVESLTGVPYRHLESVALTRPKEAYKKFSTNYSLYELSQFKEKYGENRLKDFIIWYLRNGHLNFHFSDGQFHISQSYFDYMIDISNCFIEFYNSCLALSRRDVKYLFDKGILAKVFAIDGIFCEQINSHAFTNIDRYQNKHICWFKRQEIKSKIDAKDVPTAQDTLLLNQNIAMFIYNTILIIINYYYRNEHTNNSNANSQEGVAQASQRAIFI